MWLAEYLAADRVGISPQTLRRLVAAGETPAPEVVVERGVVKWKRYDVDALDDLRERIEAGEVVIGHVAHRRGQTPSRCGTTGGFTKHYRNEEPPCAACKAAHDAYRASRRRDSGGIDGGFLLAFAVILAVVLVYVAAGGAR